MFSKLSKPQRAVESELNIPSFIRKKNPCLKSGGFYSRILLIFTTPYSS